MAYSSIFVLLGVSVLDYDFVHLDLLCSSDYFRCSCLHERNMVLTTAFTVIVPDKSMLG